MSISCFCYIRLFVFLQIAELHLPIENQTFLILLSGCPSVQSLLWWCVNNMTLIPTDRGRCTDTTLNRVVMCFCEAWAKRMSGLEPLSFHDEESVRHGPHREGEHSWERKIEREGNIVLIIFSEHYETEAEMFISPRLLGYLSSPVLLVNSVWFGSSCNQWSHKWHGEMSFLSCTWVMGTGWDMYRMKQAFSTTMALPTT